MRLRQLLNPVPAMRADGHAHQGELDGASTEVGMNMTNRDLRELLKKQDDDGVVEINTSYSSLDDSATWSQLRAKNIRVTGEVIYKWRIPPFLIGVVIVLGYIVAVCVMHIYNAK